MKKQLILTLGFLFLITLVSFAQYSIQYNLKNLPDSKVYLASVKGSKYTSIDSCISKNGEIIFKNNLSIPVGVYRIVFEDSLFSDIIINNESIIMSNNMDNLLDNMRILESKENKIYYDYWRMSSYINDSIKLISVLGDRIYMANKKVMSSDLDSMAKKAFELSEKLQKYTNNLIEQSKGLYVNKLLKAYTNPDWEQYKRQVKHKDYLKRSDFLKEHFFDNIDFSDSTLLYSEIFYVSCTDYLTNYVKIPSDSGFIRAVNFILSKPNENSPVYNYLLNLFVNTFSDTEWEGVFVHLVDDYLQKNTCNLSQHNKTMSERAAIIKKLKPGNHAPEISMNSTNGKVQTLYSIKSKVVLLLFWSSECPHCEEVMSQICELYRIYKPYGLEIYAVSADTDKSKWLEAIKKNKMTWINVCDFKGFESSTIENYNAYSTPTFYLLDSNKIILCHPYSPKEMNESINKAFQNN